MGNDQLNALVDEWTIKAVVASRFLLRLYRKLGDDKQANNAAQAGTQAEERAQRLGLGNEVTTAFNQFERENKTETEGESLAWKAIVEAQAGICAFHSMVLGGQEKARGMQGPRNQAAKAFHRAIKGFRVAFPEQLANEAIQSAFAVAAQRCTQACIADWGEFASPEDRLAVAAEINANILAALRDAANL